MVFARSTLDSTEEQAVKVSTLPVGEHLWSLSSTKNQNCISDAILTQLHPSERGSAYFGGWAVISRHATLSHVHPAVSTSRRHFPELVLRRHQRARVLPAKSCEARLREVVQALRSDKKPERRAETAVPI